MSVTLPDYVEWSLARVPLIAIGTYTEYHINLLQLEELRTYLPSKNLTVVEIFVANGVGTYRYLVQRAPAADIAYLSEMQ
jgi:hypothetical protein